jgi:hypothetical protein
MFQKLGELEYIIKSFGKSRESTLVFFLESKGSEKL